MESMRGLLNCFELPLFRTRKPALLHRPHNSRSKRGTCDSPLSFPGTAFVRRSRLLPNIQPSRGRGGRSRPDTFLRTGSKRSVRSAPTCASPVGETACLPPPVARLHRTSFFTPTPMNEILQVPVPPSTDLPPGVVRYVSTQPIPRFRTRSFGRGLKAFYRAAEIMAARRAALLSQAQDVFSPESHSQLELLEHVLVPAAADPTKKSVLESWNQRSTDHGDIIAASQSRSIASEIVEDLLLEYTDGKPMSEVGWGRVDEATLRELLPIRISAFNLEKRTPYFARIASSNLLAHILKTLDQAASGTGIPGAFGPSGARLVYISGHAADLAGIGGLLGLNWTADGRTTTPRRILRSSSNSGSALAQANTP